MAQSLRTLPTATPARIIAVGAVTNPSGGAPVEGLEARLLEVGFEEGALIEVRHRAPLGDPISVVVDNRHISLRLAEADAVSVEPITP